MSNEKNWLIELVNGENYVYKGVHYKKNIPMPADQATVEYLSNQYDHRVLEGGREAIAYQKFACEEMESEEEAAKVYNEVVSEMKQEDVAQQNLKVVDTVKAVSSRSSKRVNLPSGVSAVQPAKATRSYVKPKSDLNSGNDDPGSTVTP